MPMSATRYGVAPYAVGGSIPALDDVTASSGKAGVNVSGSVQITGVLLLAALLAVAVIARSMGGVV